MPAFLWQKYIDAVRKEFSQYSGSFRHKLAKTKARSEEDIVYNMDDNTHMTCVARLQSIIYKYPGDMKTHKMLTANKYIRIAAAI